jgi:transcriptional regulator with XRE-family HTH domain
MEEALAHRKSLVSNPNDVTQASLAAAVGIRPPSVSGWFSGTTKSLKAETAALAAKYLRVSSDWLATGRGPMLIGNPPPKALAHQLSDDGHRLLPPQYSWEGMMGTEMPEEFRLVIGEGSLAPLIPAGTVVYFDRTKKVRAGEGVLVEDGDGVRHFRRYRPLAGAEWEAFAMNVSYRTLNSQTDSLRIIAVYDGSRGSLADL